MLTCKLNPSIGFVIFGHQSMECRFTQNPPFPPQAYEGALNIDLGVTAGGALGWAVFAPTAGPPPGALAGEYVGASGDIGLGLGAGANMLVGGSERRFAPQPVSVEGSVAIDVTVGLSGLQLRGSLGVKNGTYNSKQIEEESDAQVNNIDRDRSRNDNGKLNG